jgi:hypothetical protein
VKKKLIIFFEGAGYSIFKIGHDIKMFFDLNDDNYEFVSNRDHPAIDIAIDTPLNTDITAKIHLKIDIFHSFENQIVNITHWPKNRYHVVTGINKKSYVSQQVLSVDFIFNRTKAYYQNYPFRSGTNKWYYLKPEAYPMLDLPESTAKIFIFLAPNKTYNNTRVYRTRLVNFLKQNFGDWALGYGFIGNCDDSPDMHLYGHLDFKTVPDNSHDLFLLKDGTKPSQDCYMPIHNSYYYHTFISIYAETIEYGDTIVVSEKTYDPLIRGHFILPFSTEGFIQHLKTLGFLFPEFIDYTYDAISDPDLRYQAYENEIRRLTNFDIQTWRDHWDQNLNLLYHNKKVFVDRPYDRIDFDQLIQSTHG